MSAEKRALALLAQHSTAHVRHLMRHYLYFGSLDVAKRVASALRGAGFETEARDADHEQWLLLATISVVPSDELVEATRVWLEELAQEHGGEYDGWEAEIVDGQLRLEVSDPASPVPPTS